MTLKEMLRTIYFNYDFFIKLCQYYLDNSTAPVAEFSADATSISPGTFVAFTDASTGEAPLSHAWSFGDGGVSSSDAAVVNYQYNTPGIYTVSLIVEDSVGIQVSEIKVNYITVA